jgi:hypothetical protein
MNFGKLRKGTVDLFCGITNSVQNYERCELAQFYRVSSQETEVVSLWYRAPELLLGKQLENYGLSQWNRKHSFHLQPFCKYEFVRWLKVFD